MGRPRAGPGHGGDPTLRWSRSRGQLAIKDPKTHQVRRVVARRRNGACTPEGTDRSGHRDRPGMRRGPRMVSGACVLSDRRRGSEPSLQPRPALGPVPATGARLGLPCRLPRPSPLARDPGPRRRRYRSAMSPNAVGQASARMTLDVYGHPIDHADRRAEAAATLLTNERRPRNGKRRSSTRVVTTKAPTLFEQPGEP